MRVPVDTVKIHAAGLHQPPFSAFAGQARAVESQSNHPVSTSTPVPHSACSTLAAR